MGFMGPRGLMLYCYGCDHIITLYINLQAIILTTSGDLRPSLTPLKSDIVCDAF